MELYMIEYFSFLCYAFFALPYLSLPCLSLQFCVLSLIGFLLIGKKILIFFDDASTQLQHPNVLHVCRYED